MRRQKVVIVERWLFPERGVGELLYKKYEGAHQKF